MTSASMIQSGWIVNVIIEQHNVTYNVRFIL